MKDLFRFGHQILPVGEINSDEKSSYYLAHAIHAEIVL